MPISLTKAGIGKGVFETAVVRESYLPTGSWSETLCNSLFRGVADLGCKCQGAPVNFLSAQKTNVLGRVVWGHGPEGRAAILD
jgi:hypothetical protein